MPADRYWGAQTQRSLIDFSIGDDRMPKAVYHAYGHVKKAASIVNGRAGRLPGWMADLIERVSDEVIGGALDENFPLYVWQTGSGTQSNMNTNEVISNRAIQLTGGRLGSKAPVHPNDHVNMGQSSNDTFPTAMHIAAVKEVHEHLLPAVQALRRPIEAKAGRWQNVVKTGRTQLEDAVPLTVGREWSGYAHQLRQAMSVATASTRGLFELAAGGTAVGTGLNAPEGIAEETAHEIAEATGYPFVTAANKFAAQGGLDAMVNASAGLRALAVPLMKIANDIRWLASGPRCGLGELVLPANGPGSSIMPGKVNPTQCEAMVMVCIQVLSEDSAIAFAGSQGNFELNAMRPVIISNFLHAATILGDACEKLREYCVEGAELHSEQVADYVDRSLMLVTALSPEIGYDKASAIAHKADDEGTTLREAAVADGFVNAAEFDRIVDPAAMVGPSGHQ
ncbi:class II fumarate hydratase [Streptomyces sp. NBC_01571]|uniref:class II fumarate hydratase n=1 Tax=Streptomyces sp. NBC_01571 TaxID=2975883 RepID=UPI0022566AC9|nr:class II fumarate hydratase [Streptomyces sp. NBC_01571]MCX4579378.1 class II fumarate hydratase [Streptomyces sp. NBC_01571]